MESDRQVKSVMVVGAMINEHLTGAQQSWVEMIEKALDSKGYFPGFNEFAKIADDLGVSQATPEELKTVWWEKYQGMVNEIGDVLSGTEQ